MLNQNRQSNLFEKRQAWKSRMEKPIGPGLLVTLIPTLVLCTFLVLAAPYLKTLAMRMLKIETEHELVSIELVEDDTPMIPQNPPPNPERVIAKIYQDLYDKEGFDWRKKPVIEFPEEERVEIQKEIKPVPVEIPLMSNVPMVELNGHEEQ